MALFHRQVAKRALFTLLLTSRRLSPRTVSTVTNQLRPLVLRPYGVETRGRNLFCQPIFPKVIIFAKNMGINVVALVIFLYITMFSLEGPSWFRHARSSSQSACPGWVRHPVIKGGPTLIRQRIRTRSLIKLPSNSKRPRLWGMAQSMWLGVGDFRLEFHA